MTQVSRLAIGWLYAESRDVGKMFSEIEPRPWTVDALCVELIAEYGSLAHCVMDYGKYKITSNFNAAKAEDECSDVIFILMRLLDESGSSISPNEVVDFDIPSSEEDPQQLFLDASKCLHSILCTFGTPDVRPYVIESAISIARLAACMNLRPLEQAHDEAMRRTRLWIKSRSTSRIISRVVDKIRKSIHLYDVC